MTLPIFSASDDPGPSFADLLRRTRPTDAMPEGPHTLAITHGTTVLGVRYADGVVMAGDRRATSGNLIAHKTMEKVFPADRFSGVAIAGAAGPAVEMVKLFQLQLEHYEKVEGVVLSLEGKANQLGQMVRSNLPAAMQGLAVVPLFAGYDLLRGEGRLFEYDVTGGRYEEQNHVESGSGQPPRRHGREARLPRRPDPRRGDRPGGPRALPSRRGGLGHRRARPDPGHLPGGGHHQRRGLPAGRRRRAPHQGRGHRGGRCRSHDDALLRRSRAGDEGPGRLRPQGHRPGAQRRRRPLHRGHPHRRREQLGHPAQGQRDLRPHRLRRGRQVQRVRPAPHRRRPPRRPQGLPVQP